MIPEASLLHGRETNLKTSNYNNAGVKLKIEKEYTYSTAIGSLWEHQEKTEEASFEWNFSRQKRRRKFQIVGKTQLKS